MVYPPIKEYVLVKNSVNRKGLALGIYSEGVIFYECDGITSLYDLTPGKHIRFYESQILFKGTYRKSSYNFTWSVGPRTRGLSRGPTPMV